MAQHPRLKYFPWHEDYINQANVFAPYVMAVAKPGYRSKSLNIDEHGFRFQYDSNLTQIDLMTARSQYVACSLLLGNSTSFGVSLSSDSKTLGHFMGQPERPCINLSVRGATMQQELAIFLNYKHILPKPTKITLLSGICDISLATQPEDFWSKTIGGMHSVETFFKFHYERTQSVGTRQVLGKKAFMDWAEEQYHKYSFLKKRFERNVQPSKTPDLTFESVEKKVRVILALIDNVIESWGWIAKSSGIDIELILQPVIGWTKKPLSTIERLCIDADADRIAAIPYYANEYVYECLKRSMDSSCRRHGISFRDSNIHFDSCKVTETLFTDICHLTDSGAQKLAEWISR